MTGSRGGTPAVVTGPAVVTDHMGPAVVTEQL